MRFARAGSLLIVICVVMLALGGKLSAPAAGQSADPVPLATPVPGVKRTYLPIVIRPPVPYGTSLYMGSLSTTFAYTYGCETGARDLANPGTQDSLVILAYGQAWVEDGQYGIWNFSGPFGSLAQVSYSAREFARGYWACSGADNESHIMLAIGINNLDTYTDDWSCWPLTICARTHGERWAQMVAETDQWVVTQGYGQQVTIAGAIDIEQEWVGLNQDWGPAITKAWVDGFDAQDQGKYIYYNFGTCTTCPTRDYPNLIPENGWKPWDIYYVSYGVPSAWPIPEIYLNDGRNAREWAYLSHLASISDWGGFAPIYFPGLMTEWQACQQHPSGCDQIDNTPQEGYDQLMSELAYWPQTTQPNIPLVTDIKWTPRQSDGPAWAPTGGLLEAVRGQSAAAENSLLAEKLAVLERLAAGRAPSGPQPAKPLDAMSAAPPVEVNPPAPRPVGILTQGRPPLSGMAFADTNAWAGEVNGDWTVIFAGYDPQNPAQGLLVVYLPDAGYLSILPAPTPGGALTVTGFTAGQLSLQDASGALLMFDVSNFRF